MKHLRFARCLPWLLIAVSPPLLGHCGGAVEHGTETGNPPVVEQQKLHVVLRDDGVVVVGDPGAVSPGATVSVTNVRSGDRSEATADTKGSVSISVPGTLDDEYEVTVSSGGRSQTVRVSAAGSGGTDAGSQLTSASCDSLEQALRDQVNTEYAGASKACQVDTDCTTGSDVGCYYSCGGPILSVTGLETAQQALLESTAPVCAELTSRCPGRGPSGCPFSYNTLGCNSGTCGQLSCEGIQSRLRQRIDDIVNNAPHGCVEDADCTLLGTSVYCIADCGSYRSVPATSVAALAEQVHGAEMNACSEFDSRPCPPDVPLPCLADEQPRAACIAGQCDIVGVPRP